MGALTLASCKKTVQPSAFTSETSVASITLSGTVAFNYGKSMLPADGDYTVVTATDTDNNTFSVRPDHLGNFILRVPLKYKVDKMTFSLKAKMDMPQLGQYEGGTTAENVPKNGVKDNLSIKCEPK